MYNYGKGKESIERILGSSTRIIDKESMPVSDYEFSYTNGIKTWVGCMFVDLADSHILFDNADEDTIRVMRCLYTEVVNILKENKNSRKISIRDDTVYSIIDLRQKEDLAAIFDDAVVVNTFMRMFNKILVKRGFKPLTVGIGLGCDYELIVKIGNPHNGVEKLYIGQALGNAGYFANVGNRNGRDPIVMSPLFYKEAIKVLVTRHPDYTKWIKPVYDNNKIVAYECNLVNSKFSSWIDENI